MEGNDFSEKGDEELHDKDPNIEADRRAHLKKEVQIFDACHRRDIEELQALAQSSGGFLTDELRQQACKYNINFNVFLKMVHSLIIYIRAHIAWSTTQKRQQQGEGILLCHGRA